MHKILEASLSQALFTNLLFSFYMYIKPMLFSHKQGVGNVRLYIICKSYVSVTINQSYIHHFSTAILLP